LLTVRMGKLGNLDELLATHLNGLAVNTELARKLMRVMDDMKRRQDLREAEAAANGSATATFPASTDFGTFVTAAGLTVQELMDLALRFKGEASALRSLGANALAGTSATAGEYDEAITELQSIFDSLNTENDIKKLRVDSLHNDRMSTLVGMSSLLEGALTQARTVGRNL
jgi:cellobiose phosphorylase